MFPTFTNTQQQQQQQQQLQQQLQSSSPFSLATRNGSNPLSIGQFPSVTGNSITDAFKPAVNPFASFTSSSFSAPGVTTSQTGFAIPSTFSSNTSAFSGFQTPAFPVFPGASKASGIPSQNADNEVPKSVFADFMKPATTKAPEPVAPASAPSRPYCSFFQKGSCRNGENCPYLHEIPASAHTDGTPKLASGILGANFETRPKTTANYEARPKAICRYFLAGACLKGDSCKFLHESKEADDQPMPTENRIEIAAPVPSSPAELLTKRASPTHIPSIVFNTNSLQPPTQSARIREPLRPTSANEEIDTEPLSEEAAITARSRRFRGSSFIPPESLIQPTPLVSASDELIEEEEPEFASGSACIVGTLMTMCSEEEIRKRDLEMDVHVLESVQDDTGKSRTTRRADPEKMVKKYQRSAAGMHAATPSEVRPPAVLAKTADYLFSNVLDSDLVPPIDIYNFLRDRFRAIRKDFALQDQAETLAATVHEQIARYFILSHHELCEEKEDDFQKFQNLQQISHTITSLNHYYKDLRLKNGVATPSEAEFYSYQILLNMRDTNKLNDRLMNLPAHIRSSPLICVARELVASFRCLNYSRFFRALKTSATYLQKCCVHGFLWGFRSRALRVIYNGMGPVQSTFPLQSLIEILAFDDLNEALHFCKIHGIAVINDEMVKTASPLEEEVKVEWMKSRVLIGPPQPSRKAVIMGDSTVPTTFNLPPVAVDTKAKENEEMLRLEQERKRAEEERHLKELAAKQAEEALQLKLKKLEQVCAEFIQNSSRRRKKLLLKSWRNLAKSLQDHRADERRRQQLQVAQQKFSEQKTYLTALSKVARLFLTHIWLNRWRSRTWNRRRCDLIASLFRTHVWFRKWNREVSRIKQFKRLVHSKPIIPVALPERLSLPPPEHKSSFMELLTERVNSDRNRPRSDVRVHIAISIPTLRYSDAVQNRPSADYKICTAAQKMLLLDDRTSFETKCPLHGGFNLELKLVKTAGALFEQPIQGVLFFVSHQDVSMPLTNLELLRLRALKELEPNVPVVVIYFGHSSDSNFEETFRSRLPSFFEERLSFVNISSESAIARMLAESVHWFIFNKIHESTSSYISLEDVIRLRCKEIIALKLQPNSTIPVFNKVFSDIANSLLAQGLPDHLWDEVQEAKAILKDYILPEIDILDSGNIQSDLECLSSYVTDNFPGIVASQPVLSRIQQAHADGADAAGLVAVIVKNRVDSLLVKLSSRRLQLLICQNVAPLSIQNLTLMPISLPATSKSSERRVQSPSQAKKRTREANPNASIRDLKRKLLGTDRALFNQKIDELLAKIGR